MTTFFSVSVIIPVYNAAPYLEKAINSALSQKEVNEVIVIDDGSTDGSIEIIQKCQNNDNRIRLFQHPKKDNKGRSATRNLGISNASCNYIAFLDADDYYLPGRFSYDGEIFKKKIEVDGVYNAIGADFYRKYSLEEESELQLFTMRNTNSTETLFNKLMSGEFGYFSIIGLTLKKSAFTITGIFNEDLVVAEDTDIIFRLALCCKLQPGILDRPLAMRGVHENNIFNNKLVYENEEMKLYKSLFSWSYKNFPNINILDRFLERMWIINERKRKNIFQIFLFYFRFHIEYPKTLFTYLSLKYFPPFRYRNKIIFK